MARGISALMKKSADEISDDDAAEVTKIITGLTDRIMVGVPADQRASLTESQRLAVAEVFMTLPRAQSRKTRKKKSQKASRSAGSRPQSDASGSMAEARPDG
jgi:hypothetical protein